MQGSDFDESEFFRAIAASGVRALPIGRRALVALGVPVLTADYDSWLHIDDIAASSAGSGGAIPRRPIASPTPAGPTVAGWAHRPGDDTPRLKFQDLTPVK